MAPLSSHTLNIHHGPESSTTSLLFDADKSSQIEPVSKVKKTNLCIKERLEEKGPRKCPPDCTAAGNMHTRRRPADGRQNNVNTLSGKSTYVIISDLKQANDGLTLCQYCAIIVLLLCCYWAFLFKMSPKRGEATLACCKKSKGAEQNYTTLEIMDDPVSPLQG